MMPILEMDYSQLIRDVMVSEDVSPFQVPDRTARQGVRGFAELVCLNPRCSWTWSTYRAHVVIDLKKQRIDKIYKQKCKKCDREQEPTFREYEFNRLVEKALELEKKFRNPDFLANAVDNDDGNGRSGPPHESRLCEKCGWGRTQCWKKTRP